MKMARVAVTGLVAVVASACAGDRGVAQVEPTAAGASAVRFTLVANQIADSPRTFGFVAEIIGASNNDPELYCQATTWGFGDGPPLTVTPSCALWTPDVRIPTRFTQTHTYTAPGSYVVTFTYGPLSRDLALDVP